MFLKKFYSGSNDSIKITAEQGSLFAKEIANDFNPLHDVGAKRYVVPGDLLSSIVLEKYGISKKMQFNFRGMFGGDGIALNFPKTNADQFEVIGSNNKTILGIERSGERITDKSVVEALIRNYAAFSGYNFPYILVPLMAKHKVMINIARPLVLYESMTLEFEHMNFTDPKVEMVDPDLRVDGKRGDAHFNFQIKSGDEVVGKGFKKIVISGVREYEEQPMQEFVDNYLARKEIYLNR
jgi:aerobic-type carbon monoxide dehydrogenase small subunit (CoxS/CutS family)